MTDSLRDTLQRALGQGYRVERELGGGGMSRVFVARDLALDRDVVVKVLDQDSTAGVSGDHFRREIQVIARLQHPHIWNESKRGMRRFRNASAGSKRSEPAINQSIAFA